MGVFVLLRLDQPIPGVCILLLHLQEFCFKMSNIQNPKLPSGKYPNITNTNIRVSIYEILQGLGLVQAAVTKCWQ